MDQAEAVWNPAVQVIVTGTAGTLLAPISATRRGCIFRAATANTQSIFWGPATVTATTGTELKAGECAFFFPGEIPGNLIQAISASGSQVVTVQDAQ